MDAEKDLSETGYNLTGDKGIVVNFPMLGYIEGSGSESGENYR